MNQYLLDVNLQQAPDQYLTGKWRVAERVLSRADPHTPLAQATHLELQPGHLRLQTSTAPATGQWAVRRDELLNRPYLLLRLGSEEVAALITRLRRSVDGHYRTLVLYFQSGLELVLVHP